MNLFNFQVILATSTNANARLAKVFRNQTEKMACLFDFRDGSAGKYCGEK